MFKKKYLQTTLGQMIAIADDNHLYFLQFSDSVLVERQINHIEKLSRSAIVQGSNAILELLEKELASYFDGSLTAFTVPTQMVGTPFQKEVWQACSGIAYGSTVHYQGLARLIDRSGASRAVGTALGSNYHALIIPCHRIVRSTGTIGNYAAGAGCKKSLLEHERFFKDIHEKLCVPEK